MPGQYYCFVPFTAGEADQHLSEEKSVVTIAKTWKKDADEFLVAARKRPIIIQYDPATANLLAGDFKALEDTIYIIGHCRQGGNNLASSRAGVRFDRAELDSSTIVGRLQKYIPIATVNFKLLACFGGADHVATPEEISKGEKAIKEESFASKFFSELKKKYSNAILTAYLLPIKGGLDGLGHKQTTLEDGSGNGGRPSANSVRFPKRF